MEKIEQLIPRRKGLQLLGMSVSTGGRRAKQDPDFPKAIVIGPGRFGFKLSEIERYIETRPAAVVAPMPPSLREAQNAARERKAADARRERIKKLEEALAREKAAEAPA